MKWNFGETVLNWVVEKRQTANCLLLQDFFFFLSILMFELGYL